ncbi:inorganic pyrophosphatase [Coemansia sp. Benny D160-2]|nr:inorganic pyrophosphatase [Coemansia sp. Benny D160-2]
MLAKGSGFLGTGLKGTPLSPFSFTCRREPRLLRRRCLSKYATNVLGGPLGSATHRMYFEQRGDGAPLSPWHDIPLVASSNPTSCKEYHMVCEIPRWTNAKLEIDTKGAFNPIRQDVKNGKLRYVPNVFPYKGYIWNYGALPQTYEDPDHVDADTGCVGDSDPVDVIEIGQAVSARGSVHSVKVLGVLALIDDGETDWKVVALRSDDPLAGKVHSVGDLESHMPGILQATVDWFTKYKVPDGKPLNRWAFGGSARDEEYAHSVIAATHDAWKKLVATERHTKFSLVNTTVESSPHYLTPSDASNAFKAMTDITPGQMYTGHRLPQSSPNDAYDGGPDQRWHYVRTDHA